MLPVSPQLRPLLIIMAVVTTGTVTTAIIIGIITTIIIIGTGRGLLVSMAVPVITVIGKRCVSRPDPGKSPVFGSRTASG